MHRIALCAAVGLLLLAGVSCESSRTGGDNTVQGYLSRGESRVYRVDLSEGLTYALRLSAPDGFYVALFSPDDNLIEGRYVQNGWAQVTYRSLYAGAYHVRVGSEVKSGNYRLSVR
jgi:hypothetical protein